MISAGPSWGPIAPLMLAITLATLVVCGGGCSSSGRMRAVDLPAQYLAPPAVNAQTIDLSRLGMSAPNNEIIGRGDVLDVTISAGLTAEDTVRLQTRVDERGMANLPSVGEVPVAGIELEGAEGAIAVACMHRGLYRAPHVTVTMKQRAFNSVTVVGAVEKPGVYKLARGSSDLLGALVEAGGLSKEAGVNVEIRNLGNVPQDEAIAPRIAMLQTEGITQAGHTIVKPAIGGPATMRVNLVAAVTQGSNGYYLSDGSVVMVEKRDPKAVHVIGLVKEPGSYDFPIGKEIKLLDAISLAKGLNSSVADKILIIRQMDDADPILIQCSYREAKNNSATNLRLAPGDTVSVEQTPATVMLDALRIINFGIGTSLGTVF